MSNTEQTRKPGTGIVGPVRFSYLYVYKPRQNKLQPDKEPEYEATLLIPKEGNGFCPDPKAVGAKVRDLVKEALTEKFGATAPANWRNPLRDGDTETNGSGQPKHPGYWFVKAKAQYQPLMIDGYRNPVTEEQGWQSGDWGFVKIVCYGYDQAGNKGVSVGMRAVQFTRKDEALGSAGTTPDEFDMVEGDAPASSGEYDPFADE